MALSVRIGQLEQSDEGWLFRWRDVPWWDADKLAKDDRLRRMFLNQSYEDHLGLLTCREAAEIDADFKPHSWMEDRASEVREYLGRDPWEPVFVWVYEWESGM